MDPRTGNIINAWGLSPTKYIQAKQFNGRKLPKKHAKAPFANGYRPELDFT